MKKVFLVSAILLGITLLLWGVYLFAFKKGDTVKNQQTNQQAIKIPTALLEKKQAKISPISSEAVLGAVFDKKNEKVLYFSATSGELWQVDSDGAKPVKISSTKIEGLVGALWSPDATKVLTIFKKDNQKVFSFRGDLKKDGEQLDTNIDNVAWDGLGMKISYKYYDQQTKKRSLSVADPNGENWQTLAQEIPFREVSLASVPLSAVVSFWNFPQASQESLFQSVSLMGGEVKTILKGRFGADYLWSPDGKRALVSSLINKDGKNITLGIVDTNGQYRDLNIPTIVSKCVWSFDSKLIYCGLPGGVPSGAILPDDYQAKKFTTQDTFWKINVGTASKERIVELTEFKSDYDASALFLSPVEDGLFFINRIDGKLYKIII